MRSSTRYRELSARLFSEFVDRHLRLMFDNLDTSKKYGRTVTECIGRIGVHVDGELVHEYRLDEVLAGYMDQSPGRWQDGNTGFAEWLEGVVKIRTTRGLPVKNHKGATTM